MDRRLFLLAVASFVGAAATLSANTALAAVHPRRRIRRHIRVRRRFRRRVVTRVVFGRPFWVVPVGLAVGWELMHEDRVVIVKETKIIEKDGQKTEVAIVQDSKGKTEEVAITRENTAENGKNIKGSIIPDTDKATPGVEGDAEEDADT